MTHAQAIDTHAAERYLLDEMRELERFAFEEHFFDCAECAEDVRTGALMREGVAAGLMPAAAAVSTAPAAAAAPMASPASSGWRTGLPWAVAAMLALTVGYQSLWVVPGLRDQGVATQALAPVTLRAATRGAETTVARPATGVIAFALDVNGIAADTRLAYDLRHRRRLVGGFRNRGGAIPRHPAVVAGAWFGRACGRQLCADGARERRCGSGSCGLPVHSYRSIATATPRGGRVETPWN